MVVMSSVNNLESNTDHYLKPTSVVCICVCVRIRFIPPVPAAILIRAIINHLRKTVEQKKKLKTKTKKKTLRMN